LQTLGSVNALAARRAQQQVADLQPPERRHPHITTGGGLQGGLGERRGLVGQEPGGTG